MASLRPGIWQIRRSLEGMLLVIPFRWAWAIPGNYSLSLTANGQTPALPLTVKMDPRSNASADALSTPNSRWPLNSANTGKSQHRPATAKDLRKQIE